MLSLQPATTTLARLIGEVRDDQLERPTPCQQMTVAALLDHIDGLAQAFTAAARKSPLDSARSADASRLDNDWRARIPQRLDELAQAWNAQAAWQGATRAGGVDLPGQVAGLVAIDEVVVHSWDLAVATDQTYQAEPGLVAAAYEFVAPTALANPQGTPGLFGPTVAVADDAPMFDRLLALTGRDSRWTA